MHLLSISQNDHVYTSHSAKYCGDSCIFVELWWSLTRFQGSGDDPRPRLRRDLSHSSLVVLGQAEELWGDCRREHPLGLMASTRRVFHLFSCVPFGAPTRLAGTLSASLSSYGS